MNRREMQVALSNHLRELGGEGSGNFGHAGIPGQQGGSAPGDGAETRSGSPHTKDAETHIDKLSSSVDTEIQNFKGIKGEDAVNKGHLEGLKQGKYSIESVSEEVNEMDLAEVGDITPSMVTEDILKDLKFKIDESESAYKHSKSDYSLGKSEGLKRIREIVSES